ncbi:MAG TPA: helix-turn-helix domain-containing protein [Lamprocystis sp. (in: g-proteobacteria)]|nr:helix-turn-helix domain-containing protein [Lamprocystis sp. (in: g-proteobacteria)]
MANAVASNPAVTLLNEQEAAARLRLSVRTMQLWRRTGNGPRYAKLGSAVRYSPADLDRWLAERTVNNTAQAGTA